MDYIKLIAQISSDDDKEQVQETARYYDNSGADELYYYDGQSFKEGKEEDIKTMQTICRSADIPFNVCAKVKRFEDIKKMIYAGAKRVFVKTEGQENLDAVKEASERFGADRIYLYLEMDALAAASAKENAAEAGADPAEQPGNGTLSLPERCLLRARKAVEEEGFGGIVLAGDFMENVYVQTADFLKVKLNVPVFIIAETGDEAAAADLLKMSMAEGMIFACTSEKRLDFMAVKQYLKAQKLPVNTFESAISFEDFKLNSDGMIPVITQDYKTGEVLMLAYMTKESFEKTIATGKMTYFSRSRQELWTKGDTSGHYQYVKSLTLDCDNDTILAKVAQIGAACHTGSRTCFFKELVRKEYDDRNPLAVFEDVFATILDRKEHPKEGSYTNYLFDKGIDKILKKVGEEATEIVIASKNPDAEELKYEICDFLYHMMVLMADRGVTWKEITDELAQRH
ncbi:bifunctional phosphoribosyl-AMP cyclohydrolase/phosphoribosyl-ATP pyrophosphatase [Eubacterium sp. An11]|uniref:bifunctional phosphoribosyl-AMP cyclohydrolase/phosphoribosyl-ATP diphosphatase HisIE n=1 Tax=Eubacterium sp. An11 TaxID=1965542 RepID=UPI000B37E276|nr:bifunctional phosphoribosyl-AMP cyclohydrolase/phosphoribosyl-ATP diphosphatase HisIE [Eubacterium sp. An11]OUQ69267.1 bifunctional phosphoribosyl-AMP cyclohydrolase/phosphoribosyl-ATP pyrophosphatase [Eubacterium sp. An11]